MHLDAREAKATLPFGDDLIIPDLLRVVVHHWETADGILP